MLLAALALLATLAFAMGWSPGGASAAPGSAPETQRLNTIYPEFQVWPPMVKFPPERIRDHGIWLLGSGLPPGKEIFIRMRWGSSFTDTDVTAILEGYADGANVSNNHGAFAVGLDRPFRDVGEDFLFYGQYGPVTFRFHDADTGELLGTAPLVVCGPSGEDFGCGAAMDLVSLD